ncbi:unnamed protein product [Eruca vesicaria subsp. sativa]|uniref:Uncharacterized protein n=1 Tax=Eruca vesicaria subsp. sativa TaxID=29727 RepID=A0ABC8KDL1_ERUVS|nr:unnamed protein product [Eruca vesicaria subsp. sativa]
MLITVSKLKLSSLCGCSSPSSSTTSLIPSLTHLSSSPPPPPMSPKLFRPIPPCHHLLHRILISRSPLHLFHRRWCGHESSTRMEPMSDSLRSEGSILKPSMRSRLGTLHRKKKPESRKFCFALRSSVCVTRGRQITFHA